MKLILLCMCWSSWVVSTTVAFAPTTSTSTSFSGRTCQRDESTMTKSLSSHSKWEDTSSPTEVEVAVAASTSTRQSFLTQSLGLATSATLLSLFPAPAHATGRATLEQAYRRYGPRIRAGGTFYETEFKALVQKSDWSGIQAALRAVPERTKKDLNKPDAGVAARAQAAGKFSEDKVLVAADLFASAFSSQNSITNKTKNMKEAVEKLRNTIKDMDGITKQALGQDGGGGLFGFGKKKVSEAELATQMRTLYAQGGNAWNEYVFAANDELALQFDKFEYIK